MEVQNSNLVKIPIHEWNIKSSVHYSWAADQWEWNKILLYVKNTQKNHNYLRWHTWVS